MLKSRWTTDQRPGFTNSEPILKHIQVREGKRSLMAVNGSHGRPTSNIASAISHIEIFAQLLYFTMYNLGVASKYLNWPGWMFLRSVRPSELDKDVTPQSAACFSWTCSSLSSEHLLHLRKSFLQLLNFTSYDKGVAGRYLKSPGRRFFRGRRGTNFVKPFEPDQSATPQATTCLFGSCFFVLFKPNKGDVRLFTTCLLRSCSFLFLEHLIYLRKRFLQLLYSTLYDKGVAGWNLNSPGWRLLRGRRDNSFAKIFEAVKDVTPLSANRLFWSCSFIFSERLLNLRISVDTSVSSSESQPSDWSSDLRDCVKLHFGISDSVSKIQPSGRAACSRASILLCSGTADSVFKSQLSNRSACLQVSVSLRISISDSSSESHKSDHSVWLKSDLSSCGMSSEASIGLEILDPSLSCKETVLLLSTLTFEHFTYNMNMFTARRRITPRFSLA